MTEFSAIKPIYDFKTRLDVKLIASFKQLPYVSCQYSGEETYLNLNEYLSERRFMLHNLNFDDFSNDNSLKRVWLFDKTIIHARMYPKTRTVTVDIFLLNEDVLMIDIESVVIHFRKHLRENNL